MSDGDGGILETVEIPESLPLACSPAVPSTGDTIGRPPPLRSKTPADVTPGAASAPILIESDDDETGVEDSPGAIDRVHTEPLPDRRALESRAGPHDEDEEDQRIKGEPSPSPSASPPLSWPRQVAVEIPVRRIAPRSPSEQRPSAPTAREVDDNEGDGDSDYADSEGEDTAAATASKRQKVATRPPSVRRAHPSSSSLAADAIVSLTLGIAKKLAKEPLPRALARITSLETHAIRTVAYYSRIEIRDLEAEVADLKAQVLQLQVERRRLGPLFPLIRLLAEIRLIIWEYALPDPRVILVREIFDRDPTLDPLDFFFSPTHLAIL
ncbi:hypothetical protein TESG_00703 [Trichophyton tonsurans CBS 112818]|uniref:Uncharacterized protein n=1 Tax=Trichophyton tonsurans (strain CBS 112818) TaxID=647933 RepID=F2RP93_TRIT1|nr:hypothetical protein TESG_00703 [Trichophyton tonsurans CBS 112818]